MAINYVAPSQPIINHSYGSGGGGGGGGGGNPSAERIAAGNQQLDYLRMQAQVGMSEDANTNHLEAIRQEGEMHAWVAQQTMTMQDQRDNAQIKAGVSEVQRRFANGEISRSDADFFISDLWSHGRLLKQKDDYTKVQAQADMRKQIGDQHEQQGQLIAQRTALFGKTFQDRVAFFMDPTAHSKLADEVRSLQPGLEGSNPGEFEATIRRRAEDQGLGSHWYQEDVGKWKPVDRSTMPGAPRGASGTAAEKPPAGGMSDQQYTNMRLNIEKSIKHDATQAEQPIPEGEDMTNKVNEKLQGMGLPTSITDLQGSRHPADQKAAAAKQEVAKMTDKIQGFQAGLQDKGNLLSPGEKQSAETSLAMAHKFVAKHGIPAPGSDLRAKLNEYLAAYKKIIQKNGTQATPGESPQQMLDRIRASGGRSTAPYDPATDTTQQQMDRMLEEAKARGD